MQILHTFFSKVAFSCVFLFCDSGAVSGSLAQFFGGRYFWADTKPPLHIDEIRSF
jgi:hypothetical protein